MSAKCRNTVRSPTLARDATSSALGVMLPLRDQVEHRRDDLVAAGLRSPAAAIRRRVSGSRINSTSRYRFRRRAAWCRAAGRSRSANGSAMARPALRCRGRAAQSAPFSRAHHVGVQRGDVAPLGRVGVHVVEQRDARQIEQLQLPVAVAHHAIRRRCARTACCAARRSWSPSMNGIRSTPSIARSFGIAAPATSLAVAEDVEMADRAGDPACPARSSPASA